MEELEEISTLPEVEQEEKKTYPLECYDNRELSWLKFNARVLEEANDERNPLCERLSFLSIFQSNLDEFFMVRVGMLYDQRKTPLRDNKTRMTAKEQLSEVLSEVRSLLKSKDRSYKSLTKQLKLMRVEVLKFDELSEKEKRSMERYFLSEVLPLLSPQIVASKQPFPFLNNKEIYAVARLKSKNGNKYLGIVPCSNPVLRRVIPVSSSSGRYILMEELIVHFAPRIFEHYSLLSSSLIRIVRNADISIDDPSGDSEGRKKDYRKAMEKMIQTRKRLCPVKLEYAGMLDADVVGQLCRYLKLSRKQAYFSAAPLDLSFLSLLSDTLSDNASLFYPRRYPQETPALDENRRVTDQLREKDVLLSFPYESIRPFLRLLNEAARDPEVISIKISLYRVAKNSQVTDALIQAAENGKEVLVLMELRARFDEENNVEHSRDLENAGCRLIYGLDNMKVHSKLCLITYKRGSSVEYITQVGTGNYNEKTARQYTDYSLLTSDRSIGEESASVFQALSLGETVTQTDTLLVAPNCLQDRICNRIDRETALAQSGEPAFVGFKLNSLTDKLLIDKLIEASQSGVKIRLLVRGICCLVAGIPGFTENIEVGSIVGRYLEHGRVYIFGAEGREEVYLSSADLMTRNTLHRVEVGVPLFDEKIRLTVLQEFEAAWKDNVKLRRQQESGSYAYAEQGEEAPFNLQEYLAERSYLSRGASLPEKRENNAEEELPVSEPSVEEPAALPELLPPEEASAPALSPKEAPASAPEEVPASAPAPEEALTALLPQPSLPVRESIWQRLARWWKGIG